MERTHRIIDGDGRIVGIVLRIPFRIKIRLDLAGIGADPFPVHLIQNITLKDDGRDDARSGGCLQGDLDLAEEDVLGHPDGRRVGVVVDGEGATCALVEGDFLVVVFRPVVDEPVLLEIGPGSRREVVVELPAEGRVWSAFWWKVSLDYWIDLDCTGV
jgi:xanthine/CO dehydrogenase XdhC/CoxF family maturation factor